MGPSLPSSPPPRSAYPAPTGPAAPGSAPAYPTPAGPATPGSAPAGPADHAPAHPGGAPGRDGLRGEVGGSSRLAHLLREKGRLVVAIAAGLAAGLATLGYLATRDEPAGAGGGAAGLRAGELATPPRACGTVPAPTLRQLVPGTPATAAAELAADRSRCTWRVETGGRLRLLDVEVRVFAPAPALGRSATEAAGIAFDTDRPPGRTGPPGDQTVVRGLAGLGSRAYAVRASRTRHGAVGNVAGVVVLVRNAIVTIRYDGTDDGGAGPVSLGLNHLESGALRAARDVVAALA